MTVPQKEKCKSLVQWSGSNRSEILKMLEPGATFHTIKELKREGEIDRDTETERKWSLVERQALLVQDLLQVCGFKFCALISHMQNGADNRACFKSKMKQQTKTYQEW